MKIRASVILILVCLLVDDLIAYGLYPDPTFKGYGFISHLTFLALMFVLYDQPWRTRILSGLLCGLVSDFFFTDSFPLYAFIYSSLIYIAGLAKEWIKESALKRFLWFLLLLILLDLIPYCTFAMMDPYQVPFGVWICHRGILTWPINGLMILLFQYIFDVMDRYYTIRRHRISAQEKKIYKRLRLSRK